MSYTIKHPVENKILIKQKDATKHSETGLLVNPFNDNWVKEQVGQIMYVSEGVEDEDLKPGEFVFFSKYAGANVDFNKEKFIIMSENEIFGILESDNPDFKVGDTLDIEGLLQALESHGTLKPKDG